MVHQLLAFNLGMPELLVVIAIILLLFGATKIPQLMRGMGQGINEFKKGLKESPTEEKPAAEHKDVENKPPA
ncbi:MAG: twin-arginine translocase TatA/TatE family subunit [Planctomycetes bacterium]|nr:twin-arginine translocase TatA/TatE family subunit [Planctomycetota bacterium]